MIYSFLDTLATLTGPTGSVNLGAGAGVAAEGITVAPSADTNTMTIGADGRGIHSLSADTSKIITVRLLKTSEVNAVLQRYYNSQRVSSLFHGRNVLVISNLVNGDVVTCRGVAFAREPDYAAGTEAGINEWVFHAIESSTVLGTGTPEI